MSGDYYYEYEQDNFYCYPDSYVLKNRLGIVDAEELKNAEREITSVRTAQAMVQRIPGYFDFNHLKDIHRFLFGDIYDWAGRIRNVDISKGNQFCRCEFIETQMTELLDKLKHEKYLGLYKGKDQFAERLAFYLGEINAIHPFREGNGRAQRMFMEQLAVHNHYQLDYMLITNEEMLEASLRAFNMDYEMMKQILFKALKQL